MSALAQIGKALRGASARQQMPDNKRSSEPCLSPSHAS